MCVPWPISPFYVMISFILTCWTFSYHWNLAHSRRLQLSHRSNPPWLQVSKSALSIWTGWGGGRLLSSSEIIYYTTYTPVVYNAFSSFENLGFMIHSNNPVLILIIYRPPKPNSVFIQEFSELLSYFKSKFDRVLILVDLDRKSVV